MSRSLLHFSSSTHTYTELCNQCNPSSASSEHSWSTNHCDDLPQLLLSLSSITHLSVQSTLSVFSFPGGFCSKWQIHFKSFLFHLHPLGFWCIFYRIWNLRSDAFLLSNDLVSIWSLAHILLPVEFLCGMFLVSKMSGRSCSPPERAKLLMWSVSQRHTAPPRQLIWAQFIWNTEREEKRTEREKTGRWCSIREETACLDKNSSRNK